MDVAAKIIKKLGGAYAVAALLDCHVSNVYRWTYPTDRRGGTGGLIPLKQQRLLIELGKIKAADLFPAEAPTKAAPKKRKRAA